MTRFGQCSKNYFAGSLNARLTRPTAIATTVDQVVRQHRPQADIPALPVRAFTDTLFHAG
jgi:hypothetical protein